MIVVGITAIGFGTRLALIDQSLFADKVATWWDVTHHGFRGVVETVYSDAEITPPLYFRVDRGLALVLALAVATPIGEALVSAVSTNLFGVRNLAASWPGLVLLLGAVAVGSSRVTVRAASTMLIVAAFVVGTTWLFGVDAQRPNFDGPARAIAASASPSDVIIEGSLTPGPLSSLGIELSGCFKVIRVGIPQERDHPFTELDRIAMPREVAALTLASVGHGGRVFVVSARREPGELESREVVSRLRSRFHPSDRLVYDGFHPVELLVLKSSAKGREDGIANTVGE